MMDMVANKDPRVQKDLKDHAVRLVSQDVMVKKVTMEDPDMMPDIVLALTVVVKMLELVDLVVRDMVAAYKKELIN